MDDRRAVCITSQYLTLGIKYNEIKKNIYFSSVNILSWSCVKDKVGGGVGERAAVSQHEEKGIHSNITTISQNT